ncbi:rubrerythrin [Tistrella bauzanensis]|uniref:Rubrerythrin n=1 Tax=Tistrella bauzanensis TaxID=657419 RepID=A0ABQ1IET5_9PROT|nr:rubrerythrin family protein [Tistrella bauzanensis]GGB34723.1 rubrerythrin [Tistrella bauzanensis]
MTERPTPDAPAAREPSQAEPPQAEPPLAGTRTESNLVKAFLAEAAANRRFLYFARQADVEGFNDVAAVFRSIAEGETGHALGHLEFLEEAGGDPATGMPIGTTPENLASAIVSEEADATETYPEMARTARAEGQIEAAEWFETLARAERAHAARFRRSLISLEEDAEAEGLDDGA